MWLQENLMVGLKENACTLSLLSGRLELCWDGPP
jgi:hypothetical protein